MKVEAAEAQLAAEIVEAFAVTLRELPLRTLFQSANGDHHDAHAHALPRAQADSYRRAAVEHDPESGNRLSGMIVIYSVFAGFGPCVHSRSRL